MFSTKPAAALPCKNYLATIVERRSNLSETCIELDLLLEVEGYIHSAQRGHAGLLTDFRELILSTRHAWLTQRLSTKPMQGQSTRSHASGLTQPMIDDRRNYQNMEEAADHSP